MKKISLKKIRYFALALVLVLSVGYAGFWLGFRFNPYPNEKKDLSLFWLTWQKLDQKYLDNEALDDQEMINGAISGMVSALDDPYTFFLPADDNKVTQENLQGSFGGVGIRLGYKDEVLAVISPLKNTPAGRAGVRSGDLILNIKDELKEVDQSTQDISLVQAVKLIRGEKGTEVILNLARDGKEKPFEVSLVRGEIIIPSVESEWIERNGKRFAYLHLLQFSEEMKESWQNWVVEVDKEKDSVDFGGVVLDLRNNPGGYLSGAVFIAEEFLPAGKVVVWQDDYQGNRQKLVTARQGNLLDVPLVVLINKGSASAAEILAGALRDYDRTELVGTQSFGKGTIQEPVELPHGAGLHVTIARWLLPTNESVHEKGIAPNIEVDVNNEIEDQDLILDTALDSL